MCCALLCCALLCCGVLCCSVLCCVVLFCVVCMCVCVCLFVLLFPCVPLFVCWFDCKCPRAPSLHQRASGRGTASHEQECIVEPFAQRSLPEETCPSHQARCMVAKRFVLGASLRVGRHPWVFLRIRSEQVGVEGYTCRSLRACGPASARGAAIGPIGPRPRSTAPPTTQSSVSSERRRRWRMNVP